MESENRYVLYMAKPLYNFNHPTINDTNSLSGMLVVTLGKKKFEHWSSLTKVEKKESKIPKFEDGDTGDTSTQLMSLMKQLYDDGDDEMKRTITKVWTESREKNKNMEL